ncbi:MAG: hypothetical protein II921_01170, partial [Treponema sp.]|nr:hypothetical protein [Treponema sp.]
MKQKVFLFVFFSVFLNFFIFSQDSEKDFAQIDGSAVITKISIDGLKRTKESFVQSMLEEFMHQNATEDTLTRAKTKLRLEGLFSEVNISYKPLESSEVSMEVSVKEKISFLPVPFAMYTTSTGFMGGAVVMDMNAFGIKDMAMVGGFFALNSATGMLAYTKNPRGWRPGFAVSLNIGKSPNEITDMDDRTVLEYDAFSVRASASISEKIGKHNTVSFGVNFKYLDADKDSGYDAVQLDSMTSGGFSLGWKVLFVEMNDFYTSNTSINASAGFNFSNNSDFPVTKSFSMTASLQKPLNPLPRLRLCAAVSGHYGIDNPISAYSGREAGNVSILPGKFK